MLVGKYVAKFLRGLFKAGARLAGIPIFPSFDKHFVQLVQTIHLVRDTYRVGFFEISGARFVEERFQIIPQIPTGHFRRVVMLNALAVYLEPE